MYTPYGSGNNTPRRNVAVPLPSLESLTPIENLNPENLKDLSKTDLTAYLHAHNIVPGSSKPEMKKQMRTLIHSINTNTAIPMSALNPQPKSNDLMALSGMNMNNLSQINNSLNAALPLNTMGAMNAMTMSPITGPMPNTGMGPINLALNTAMTTALNNMSAMNQAGNMPMMNMINPMAGGPQMNQMQVGAQNMNMNMINPMGLGMALPMPPMPFMAQQAFISTPPMPSIYSAPPPPAYMPATPQPVAAPAAVPQSTTPAKSQSPPGSPKNAGSEEPDICSECSKKANKECSNKRCRGCCVRHMVDTKALCLVHIKDESRRPRTKEHPHADTIASLIQQASTTFPNFSVNSTSNTPNTSTPIMSSVPGTTPMEPLSIGVSPVLAPQKSLAAIPAITTPRGVNTPGNMTPPSMVATPAVAVPVVAPAITPIPAVGATAQTAAQKSAEYTSTHKAQSQLQFSYIGMAAHYVQQISNHRLAVPRDDKYSFFSCFKCDKIISVNGSSILKHLQAEHSEELIPFLKNKISQGALLNDQQDILYLSKSKAQERYSSMNEWLEELFSAEPPREVSEYESYEQRKEKILNLQHRLQAMMEGFEAQNGFLDSLKNESTNFYQYYDQLAHAKTVEELESLGNVFALDKDIHFEQRGPLITPIPPQQFQMTGQPGEFSFNLQSL
eukprot:gene19413-23246_t